MTHPNRTYTSLQLSIHIATQHYTIYTYGSGCYITGWISVLYGLVTVSIGNDVMHTQLMNLPSQCAINLVLRESIRSCSVSYSYSSDIL